VQFQQIIEIVWWKNQNHRDTESFEFWPKKSHSAQV
jgi:hypothetical protein